MTVVTGVLMAITLAGALLAVSLRNILHAVFGLAVALFGIAGLFVVLGSPFLAAMEVLIYVGGISIAMIFVVMLSSVEAMRRGERPLRRLVAAAAAAGVFAAIAVVVGRTELLDRGAAGATGADWSVARIGVDLLDRYNVVFEALSVVLLMAIVGAIVIARRDAEPGEEAP